MLKELRTLVAIARHGSFSRAGEQIGLTQSAVSAQMQRLEEMLGFALFDRHGRSATLNAAGRQTLERAAPLIAMAEQLQRPLGVDPLALHLRIGAIASVQAAGLPEALRALCGDHPGLRLRVVPGVSLSLLGQVDAGELDAALLIEPPFVLPPELVWQPLWTEPFVLLAPAGVTGEDWRQLLQQHAFLRYDRASFGGRLVSQFLHAQGLVVHDLVEMDELGGLVQMVANGLGVALLPHCRPHFPVPAGVRVLSLGEDSFQRRIGLLERAQHPQTAAVRGLRDALLAWAGRLA